MVLTFYTMLFHVIYVCKLRETKSLVWERLSQHLIIEL